MAPFCEINVEDIEPMSRTYQYRKVMKPLLERKRRARINKCLDNLKDLMVGALPKDCESITKLEKADVLELTVEHLKKLKHYNALALPAQSHSHEKFNSGFRQCVSEVTRFLKAESGVDVHVGNRLLGHLGNCMSELEKFVPVQTSTVHHVPSASTASAQVTVNVQSKMYTPPASPDMHQLTSSNSPSSVSGSVKSSSSFVPFHPPRTIQPNLAPPSIIKQECGFQVVTASSNQQNHSIPPSPPLSVGSPSPLHHLNRPSSSSSDFSELSPKPSLFSPSLRASLRQPEVTDGRIWRPW